MNKGMIDLSIFVINPTLWKAIPDSDTGVLNNTKVLYMPRYMNHKSDVTVNTALSGYQCLIYGSLGVDAAVHNYTAHILSGECDVAQSYAYCFDKLEAFTDGLNEVYVNNIIKLSNKTKRISRIRSTSSSITETKD